MTTYTVAPTDGERWRVLADGQACDGYVYDTREAAQRTAERAGELDALDDQVETAIGQDRRYGITVWSEPRQTGTPIWRITDPHHGQVGFAFAHYSDLPPAVNVYDRDQYERACAAVGLDAAADVDLGTYGDRFGAYDVRTYTPVQVITVTLRRRRMAGLAREHDAARPVTVVSRPEMADQYCAQCGQQIAAGVAMVASLGLACGPDCYDAMAG